MNPKKTFILLGLIFIINYSGYCQENSYSICFSYDENGNRIRRETCNLKIVETDSTDTTFQQLANKLLNPKGNNRLYENISVFPNPTNGQITISFQGSLPKNCALLWIYSLKGQEVYQSKICNWENKLDMSLFAPGTYILVIKSEDQSANWKIIREQG